MDCDMIKCEEKMKTNHFYYTKLYIFFDSLHKTLDHQTCEYLSTCEYYEKEERRKKNVSSVAVMNIILQWAPARHNGSNNGF